MGIWDRFLQLYDVTVAREVALEAKYFKTGDSLVPVGKIDLQELENEGLIKIVDPEVPDLVYLKQAAVGLPIGSIEDGERDSLVVLVSGLADGLVACMKDRAAIKFAVCAGLKDALVSVEYALNDCGLRNSFLRATDKQTAFAHLRWALSEDGFQAAVSVAEVIRTQNLLG